jgi:N-acetylmuramoyl-L-alanine amidase
MSQITFLLDNGHGGLVDGKYTTAPNFDKNNKSTWKKSWYHPEEDLVFFEGVFNRQVINLVKTLMDTHCLKYIDVVNSDFDISLGDRVRKANAVYEGDKSCVYFSMHGNASGSGKANGIEIFTSKGQTKSDALATIVFNAVVEMFPDEKYRKDTWSDGDVDKEANYYVLKQTNMPAMLLEMFFFDNLEDCKKMVDHEVQLKIAQAIVNGFLDIQAKSDATK